MSDWLIGLVLSDIDKTLNNVSVRHIQLAAFAFLFSALATGMFGVYGSRRRRVIPLNGNGWYKRTECQGSHLGEWHVWIAAVVVKRDQYGV